MGLRNEVSANAGFLGFTNPGVDIHEEVQIRFSSFTDNVFSNSNKIVGLGEIFDVFRTVVEKGSVDEEFLECAIQRQLLGSEGFYISDNQLLKKVLIKLESLGLVSSKWDFEKARLFWSLA